MIVFDKWLIVTPERCASYALETHLATFGGYRIQLPEGRHTGVIPERFADLKKVIIVRNPYRRIESLYRLMCGSMFWRKSIDYSEWAKRALCNLPTCHQTHKACQPAEFVRVEELERGLLLLGFPADAAKVPRFHESTVSPETFITPEIRAWARPDLWYGYSEE